MMPVDLAAAAAATLADLLEERRHHALLVAGLDLIDQGIMVMDGDLKLVAASRGLFKLFGFPAEMSHVGTPFAAFSPANSSRTTWSAPGPTAPSLPSGARPSPKGAA
jgi:hypothetical protein